MTCAKVPLSDEQRREMSEQTFKLFDTLPSHNPPARMESISTSTSSSNSSTNHNHSNLNNNHGNQNICVVPPQTFVLPTLRGASSFIIPANKAKQQQQQQPQTRLRTPILGQQRSFICVREDNHSSPQLTELTSGLLTYTNSAISGLRSTSTVVSPAFHFSIGPIPATPQATTFVPTELTALKPQEFIMQDSIRSTSPIGRLQSHLQTQQPSHLQQQQNSPQQQQQQQQQQHKNPMRQQRLKLTSFYQQNAHFKRAVTERCEQSVSPSVIGGIPTQTYQMCNDVQLTEISIPNEFDRQLKFAPKIFQRVRSSRTPTTPTPTLTKAAKAKQKDSLSLQKQVMGEEIQSPFRSKVSRREIHTSHSQSNNREFPLNNGFDSQQDVKSHFISNQFSKFPERRGFLEKKGSAVGGSGSSSGSNSYVSGGCSSSNQHISPIKIKPSLNSSQDFFCSNFTTTTTATTQSHKYSGMIEYKILPTMIDVISFQRPNSESEKIYRNELASSLTPKLTTRVISPVKVSSRRRQQIVKAKNLNSLQEDSVMTAFSARDYDPIKNEDEAERVATDQAAADELALYGIDSYVNENRHVF